MPDQTNHIAAIHALKSRLGLSDDDYRALLRQLTGQDSSKSCTQRQRWQVRQHMQRLAERTGVARPAYTAERPVRQRSVADGHDERWAKARALWALLARAGVVRADTDAALMAYVCRQTQVSHWRFANSYQINTVIESLKLWCMRAGVELRRA